MNVTSTSYASQVYQTHKTTATKAVSSYDATAPASTQVDKMDEMKEKYADVYTPIPETYTKESEDLQNTKIKEAYPDYVSFKDFLKVVDGFLEGDKIQLGQQLTPAQEEKQKQDYDQAYEKAYEVFGGKEAVIEMQKGIQEIQNNYPVNNFGKDSRVTNEVELARFTNAAVYEGLEQGKTIEEAKSYAGNLRSSFMDTSYSIINFLETSINAGQADTNAVDLYLNKGKEENSTRGYNVDYTASNNATMDLREYGIEGYWDFYEIKENQADMISEIEKKMNQFNFMLNIKKH